MFDFRKSRPMAREESGAGTSWWVLWMIMFMVMGGLAIDSANARRMRAELQYAADAAAHAGVIDLPDQVTAKASANAMASNNMDASMHGDVLSDAEIEFGMWDTAADKFIGIPASPPIIDAVRVTTRRDATNLNRMRTSFLQLIGMDSWNISARAVAQRYFPKCNNRDGIYARKIVDLQSNNIFRNGICIHGNDHVELNNGNVWEPGVSVTMPHLADLVTPSSDLEVHNPGLTGALGEEYYNLKIVDEAWKIVHALKDPNSPYTPSYIGVDEFGAAIPPSEIVVTVDHGDFKDLTHSPGHIYFVTCETDKKLTIENREDVPFRKLVIVAQCRMRTRQGSVFEDVIIAGAATDEPTDPTHPRSINIGQDNRLGLDDNCAPGGGVKLFANGGIMSETSLEGYGLQAVATKDIDMTPHTEGLEGILLQAGGDISITSNNAFGSTCPNLDEIALPYYRLVL